MCEVQRKRAGFSRAIRSPEEGKISDLNWHTAMDQRSCVYEKGYQPLYLLTGVNRSI